MRNNILLITGGTAGHVIPSENLGNFLLSKNRNCVIISDKRGYNYINNFNGKLYLINSSNLNGNIIKKLIGLCSLILGFFQSLFIVLYFKPSKVIVKSKRICLGLVETLSPSLKLRNHCS